MVFLHALTMLGTGLAGLDAETGVWTWNSHDADWIFQNGPSYDDYDGAYKSALKDPYYNQWGKLNIDPHEWGKLDEGTAETLQHPFQAEDWQLKVNGIY